MKTEVLVERLPDNRYRVKGSGFFSLSAEGVSREEALNNFQISAIAYVSKDAEILQLDIPIRHNGVTDVRDAHPLARFAGVALSNPLYPMFLEQMKRNREADEAENVERQEPEGSAA